MCFIKYRCKKSLQTLFPLVFYCSSLFQYYVRVSVIKYIFKFFFQPRAETLVEVIIAVSVLLIIMTPASTTAVSGLRAIKLMREYAVAESLASEGIEGVRYVRESNLLRLSADPLNCWNMKDAEPPITNTDNCTAANRLAAGKYKVGVKSNGIDIAVVKEDIGVLDLSNGVSNLDRPFLLTVDNVTGLYTHETGAGKTDSLFFREITLSYDPNNPNIMLVISKVEWNATGGVSNVVYTDVLTAGN